MVSAGVVITTGVNNEGHQGWPGFDVITTEDWARWAALRRSSVARGLSCMALVTSDDRSGLKVESPPSCRAGWQRCRVHFSTDLSARVPKACQGARGRHPGVHDLEPPDHDSAGISTPGRYTSWSATLTPPPPCSPTRPGPLRVLDFPARAQVQHQEQ